MSEEVKTPKPETAEAAPESKAESKMESKPEAEPEAAPESKMESKPETKTESAESGAESKTESKSETKPESAESAPKPAAARKPRRERAPRAAKPEAAAGSDSDSKPESKSDSKPEAKSEAASDESDKKDGAPSSPFSFADAPTAPVQRKRGKRHVPEAIAHVTATFNNTIVTFADQEGKVIAWATTGSSGFKGARKGTPYAAQIAAENAGRKAQEHGVESVEVRVRGVGSGRDSAVRAINALGIRIGCIRDVTPVPHNGCRPPKRRRV